MKNYAPVIFSLLAVLLLASSCSRQISFAKDVKTILDANCLSCHDGSGEGSAKSSFSTVDYNSVMMGTKFGPVIIPGDSISSSLYLLISHKTDKKIQMPPHHNVSLAEGRGQPLTEQEITIIKNWIDQGALNN